MKINENFSLLRSNYLFSTMSRKIKDYKIAHPEADIIDLGIGDVSRPLPEACIKAMHSAVNEMADAATFRGYPPERGYDFLIDKILKYDFAARGITLERDEIFISDGAKSDTGSIGDIFSPECKVAVCDPVYPVYVDTNVMAGRKIIFAEHYDEHREFWRRELTDYLETCRQEQLLLPEIDAPAFAEQLMNTILDLRLNGTVREELRLFCRTILRGAGTRKGIELIDRKP